MPDIATWTKRAAEFRRRALMTREAERERVLNALADHCDEQAARLRGPAETPAAGRRVG